MRNLPGLIVAILCSMCIPAQAQAAKASRAAQIPKAGKIFRDCPTCPEMVVIPSGHFDMGSPGPEAGRARP